jgi:hypothetical protein
VAGRKDKRDRLIAERLSGAMYRWWAYIKAAGIVDDRKGWLLRSAIRKNQQTHGVSDDAQGCLVHGAPSCFRCGN